MPFKIVRNDIAKMKTEAIVNAANSELQMGGGSCGAIFKEAGAKKLQEACNEIGRCSLGEAVITKGFDLNAKYIIHTVGPIWRGGARGEKKFLYNAYKSSLELALKHNIKSISFPLISSGIYGYPKDKALKVAMSAIGDFLLLNDMDVYLVLYGKDSLLLGEKLFYKIEKYIDDNYVKEKSLEDRYLYEKSITLESFDLRDISLEENYLDADIKIEKVKKRNLEDIISNKGETFSQMLLRLIDEKGLSDVEVYKRANIDRRLFSKIRSDKDYSPSKITVISFAISLKLNLDETSDLLQTAGFALSPSSKFDIIIEFFIKEENFNIYEINEALFDFKQNLLGA